MSLQAHFCTGFNLLSAMSSFPQPSKSAIWQNRNRETVHHFSQSAQKESSACSSQAELSMCSFDLLHYSGAVRICFLLLRSAASHQPIKEADTATISTSHGLPDGRY